MQHVRGHVPALVRPPAARSPEPQPVPPILLSPPSPSAGGSVRGRVAMAMACRSWPPMPVSRVARAATGCLGRIAAAHCCSGLRRPSLPPLGAGSLPRLLPRLLAAATARPEHGDWRAWRLPGHPDFDGPVRLPRKRARPVVGAASGAQRHLAG